MAERIRTISVGECDSDIGIGINDIFSSSIHSEPSLMNTSTISTSSQDSQQRHGGNLSKSPHNLQSKQVRNSFLRNHSSMTNKFTHFIFLSFRLDLRHVASQNLKNVRIFIMKEYSWEIS